MKRTFDIVLAIGALVVLSPVMAAIAALVRWKLGSPVLFRQARPGLHARPFEMLKFRTMTDARDSEGRLRPDAERLTRFGRFLRSTSLDELPELWNVLKGEMSLVGPRPLLMEYLPYYTVEERRRHAVRPGITGWSQVNGRNAARWDERLKNDLWYVDHRTLRLDLRILAMTVKKTIWREGLVSDPRSAMQDLNVERSSIFRIEKIDKKYTKLASEILRTSYDMDKFSHTVISSHNLDKFFEEVAFAQDKFVGAFRQEALIGVLQARELSEQVHLNNIAVVGNERGWGVADALMKAFFELAQGRETDLFVDSRNEKALRFYERLGYKEAERERFSQYNSSQEVNPPDLIPDFRIENIDYLSKYGFCRILKEGVDGYAGFVSPDNFSLSTGARPEMLASILKLGGRMRVTFPSELEPYVAMDTGLTRWERIRLVRAASPGRYGGDLGHA